MGARSWSSVDFHQRGRAVCSNNIEDQIRGEAVLTEFERQLLGDDMVIRFTPRRDSDGRGYFEFEAEGTYAMLLGDLNPNSGTTERSEGVRPHGSISLSLYSPQGCESHTVR